ncbi:MAG: DUF3124 domain-containing protein [Deltaproteobacteria bacterium]|nr:DUF3124 domain-containing protein [Deltaproteobacteria bacterium]
MTIAVAAALVCSCTSGGRSDPSDAMERSGAAFLAPEDAERLAAVTPHTVYVPVYSHIYHQEDRVFDLTATLSIRNTDEQNRVIIHSVRYFDTAGHLVRSYAAKPLALPAMATLEYVVGEGDTAGGSGANFVVEWSADEGVSEPVIEAVMIGTRGQQGLSFLSVGKTVR